MTQKGGQLQRWVDRAADVPVQLRRYFKLIRDLDEKVQTMQDDAVRKCRLVVTGSLGKSVGDVPDKSPPPKKHKTMHENEQITGVRQQLDQVVGIAEEKYRIAVQLYDFVDQHIKGLDKDLASLDQEINNEYERLQLVDDEQVAGQAAGPQRKKRGRKADKAEEPAPIAAPIEPIPAGDLAALEPKYCICQGVSHGNMVGCDNEDCPIEWFHFECVGLSEAPTGTWYCPSCRKDKAGLANA